MSGARVTIYLTKEMDATTRLLGINVSEVCQRALAVEIETRLEALRAAVKASDDAGMLLNELNADQATKLPRARRQRRQGGDKCRYDRQPEHYGVDC